MRGDTGTAVKEEGRHLRYLTCCEVTAVSKLRTSRPKTRKLDEKIIAALKRATRAHVALQCGAVIAVAHLELERSVRVQRNRLELVYFAGSGEEQPASRSRRAGGTRTRHLER